MNVRDAQALQQVVQDYQIDTIYHLASLLSAVMEGYYMWWTVLFLMAILGLSHGGCSVVVPLSTAPPFPSDGTYIGENEPSTPQFIRVAVDIAQGRIVAVRLLQHPAWQAPQQQELLLRRVVASQNTTEPGPRGTQSEQDQLLQAIDDALDKARTTTPATP